MVPAANAYVSGMKEELNVVGNEYQTFTTMWTMQVFGYLSIQGRHGNTNTNGPAVDMLSPRYPLKLFVPEVCMQQYVEGSFTIEHNSVCTTIWLQSGEAGPKWTIPGDVALSHMAFTQNLQHAS